MSTTWQRARSPDEVPTPIAVALSDYCRRANAPASASEVREALSALAPEDDFRVRALADGEPEAGALGPFAVVDVVLGTPAPLAVQRQACGYYELARALLHQSDAPSIPAPAPAPIAAAAPSRARAATTGETVEARIAPKKRTVSAAIAEELEAAGPVSGAAALPKRDLPKPRGRYASLPAARASLRELQGPEGRAELAALLEQHTHRFTLLRAVASLYSGPRGGELQGPELDQLLEDQDLLEALRERERNAVLAAFSDHRGANGRVAWSLEASPHELELLVKSLGLEEQVEQIRERFREEALSPRTLSARLDMLGREKYLADLGIAKRFRQQLERDLREELERAAREAPGSDPVDQVARWHAAPQELLQRALDRLGLRPRA